MQLDERKHTSRNFMSGPCKALNSLALGLGWCRTSVTGLDSTGVQTAKKTVSLQSVVISGL